VLDDQQRLGTYIIALLDGYNSRGRGLHNHCWMIDSWFQ
jgi:hypothetical protein